MLRRLKKPCTLRRFINSPTIPTQRRVGKTMVACTFCGSKKVRPSSSSTLDAPTTRVRRALTFRCLYRCRSCDALFEGIVLGSIWPRGRGASERGSRSISMTGDLHAASERLQGSRKRLSGSRKSHEVAIQLDLLRIRKNAVDCRRLALPVEADFLRKALPGQSTFSPG
jgi:hypothetical protein